MNTGKVVANAGSHRILSALADGPCDSKKLKDIVGAINSVARFDGEYMARLERSDYVKRKGELWHLTKLGAEKLDSLGPVRAGRKLTVATSRARIGEGIYKPDTSGYLRPEGQEFLKYPSRIGGYMHYRDGRIIKIGE